MRTNIAKLKVVGAFPEEYSRKQVIMYRSSDTINSGFHKIATSGDRDVCEVTPTKNAFIEPGIPSQWTFTIDLTKGFYNGEGSLDGGASYTIKILPKNNYDKEIRDFQK